MSSAELSLLSDQDGRFHSSRFSSPDGRFETKEPFNVKKKLIEAFRYVAYPRGSPLWKEVKNNLRSGFTVSLVSVPLSFSLAISSGASPELGLVTAFWAGITASLFGGSHFNIMGPTGALSGILASSSLQYGVESLPILALIAGMICILVSALKLDKYVMFIPSSVIHGFTVGVAFIIALGQLNFAFGLKELPKHESFLENTFESFSHLHETNLYALGFFLINVTALLVLTKKWPLVPWAILIAILGIVAGFLTSHQYLGPIHFQTLEQRYGTLEFSAIAWHGFSLKLFTFDLLKNSFGVAFIAILETLISARIADGMTKSEHNQRKEVGLANMVSGIAGGIPATAALARTALNIKSGATSRISALLNCLSVLIISYLALPLFKYIPMSIVASLLVMVSIRMVSVAHLKHMWKFDRSMFVVAILSAVFCVVVDTMVGILVGGVLSLLLFTDKMSVGHSDVQMNQGTRVLSHLDLTLLDKQIAKDAKKRNKAEEVPKIDIKAMEEGVPLTSAKEVSTDDYDSENEAEGYSGVSNDFEDTLVYRFSGQLTYVNATPHLQRIKALLHETRIRKVILSLDHVWYIDLDGIDSLHDMIMFLHTHSIKVLVTGIQHGNLKGMLARHPFIQNAIEEGKIFPHFEKAVRWLSVQ